MQTKKKTKTTTRKRPARRILKWTLALVVVLLLLILLLVPALISSGSFRRIILAKINDSFDGRADFADLSMGWLKGVKVEDFSFDDNAGLLSVKVKQIATKPHYASIIAGNLSFGQTTIDEPRVEISLKDRPSTATANVPGPQPQPVPIEAAGIALVTDVVVNNGSVKVTDSKARTTELSGINSKIGLRLPGEQSTLDLDMVLVAKGNESKVHADGRITPKKTDSKTGWTLKDSDGDLNIEIDRLDIESLEPFFELAGIDVKAKGNVSANLKSEIRGGQIANLSGKLNGSRLDVTAAQLKGDRLQTTALDADIKLTRKDRMISIDNLQVKADWADLNATGAVPTTLKSLDSILDPNSGSDLKGSFSCDLAAVASQMPATIGLKEGTKITSGRISGSVQTLTQAGTKQIKANADLADLKGTVEGKQVALSQPVRANALVSKDKAGMKFDQLDVSASFANVNCTGATENLKYSAAVDLAKLQSELGQFVDLGGYRMAGNIVQTGQISIDPNRIAASGAAQINNLSIASPNNVTVTEPKADLNFAVEIDKKQNLIAVNSAKVDASFGSISVKDGVVPLNEKAAKPTKLVLNAAGLDLAKLRPFAVMFASFPQDKQLAGIAESQVTLTSEKGAYKIETENTKIRNFELTAPGKKPFRQKEVSLVAAIELNPTEQTYSVKKLNLLSDQIKVTKTSLSQTTKNKKTRLEGELGLEYDWSAVGDVASNFLPQALALQGKRATSINFASEYPADDPNKLLANLRTNKCRLGFDKADYRGLSFGITDVNAQFDSGVLRIDPFTTTASGGQINLGVTADFTGPAPIIQIPRPISIKGVQIDQNLSYEFRGLLGYINPVFKDALGVGGTVDFTVDKLLAPLAPERRNDIQIAGTLAMDNVSLAPTGLLGNIFSAVGLRDRGALAKVYPTKFTVKDGFVRYDDAMRIDIGGTPIYFKGGVGLDKKLNMRIELPIGGQLGEKLGGTIALPLTGTIDAPKLDTSKLGETLIQDTFKGLIDGLLK